MKEIEGFERDRRIFRMLRPKLSQLEKMWLLDVGGDYRLYIKRLHHLAREYRIKLRKDNA